MWNNTIDSASLFAISGTSLSKIDVVNNIIMNAQNSIYSGIGEISGRNNLFFQNTSNDVTLDNPVTLLDPMFVDPDNDNYHLQKGSPAIDAGAVLALTEDFDGDKRPIGSGYDIGADEFTKTLYVFFPLIMR